MRATISNWLDRRLILAVAVLVVAPLATGAHLLATWAPPHMRVARLRSGLDDATLRVQQQVQQTCEQHKILAALRRNIARMQRERPAWLPRRDAAGVLRTLTRTLSDAGVRIEHATLDEPDLFAAVDAYTILAAERLRLRCRGSYETLTRALDQLRRTPLPLYPQRITWRRVEDQQELEIEAMVPFVPQGDLRKRMVERAGLEDEDAT